MRIRPLTAILGGLTLAAGSLLIATPASATSVSPTTIRVITCTGSEVDTLSPALTNTPKTVTTTVNAKYTCLNPGGPTATAINYQVTRTLSCEDLLLGRSGTLQLRWSNGKTSTFSFTSTVTEPNGTVVVTQTGSITAGLYAGAATQRVLTAPNLNLTACATTGISQRTAISTLTIQQL